MGARRRVDIVPHTHWDREWYTPVPDVPPAAGRPARRAAPPARGRPVLRPLPARRADGRGRRLPRRAPRGRGAAAPAGRRRPAGDGPLVHPAWTSSSCRARPWSATCSSASTGRPRFGGRHGGRLPARHVRPRRPDAPAAAPVRLRARRGVAGRARGGRPQRRSGGRRPTARPCGPSTCPSGYGNGALAARRRQGAAPADRRVRARSRATSLVGPDPLDERHRPPACPQPWLGRVVAEANALAGRLSSCASARWPTTSRDAPDRRTCPRWTGELRSGRPGQPADGRGLQPGRREAGRGPRRARARAAGRAARPRCCLPADALAGGAPRRGLARGDPQQRPRLDLRLLGRRGRATPCCTASPRPPRSPTGLADRALARPGRPPWPATGRSLVNPSARARGGLVEVAPARRRRAAGLPGGVGAPGRADRCSTTRPIEVGHRDGRRAGVRADGIRTFTVEELDGVSSCSTSSGRRPARSSTPPCAPSSAALRTERARPARAGARSRTARAVTVLARVDDVPGFGWRGLARRQRAGGPGRGPAAAPVERPRHRPGRPDRRHLRHRRPGRPRARWSTAATSATPTTGARPPTTRSSTDPASVSCRLLEHGPLRGRLEVAPHLRAARPTSTASAGSGSQQVQVRTTLELQAGDDLVRVQVELDNHGCATTACGCTCPLPAAGRAARRPSARSRSSSAASPPRAARPSWACRRSRPAASCGPAGSPSPTRACSSTSWSTSASGGRRCGRTLALTLLRCTGMLSQGPMATRPLPAGPLTPMEGPQQQGPVSARFACTWAIATRTRWSTTPSCRCSSPGPAAGRRPTEGQALAVTGAEVSAVVRVAGALHVRVFNPTAAPTTVRVDGRQGWLVDLRGRPLAPFEGSFDLAPWQIATAADRARGSRRPRRAPCDRRSGRRGARGWRRACGRDVPRWPPGSSTGHRRRGG